ncbi:substrate-binding domain-containing protein [Orenia marismortui]|uniref:Xylose-binding protein n=1 Tax=Orenia marismortui TaxID=46469 RepID=A0A4R8GQX7_9FIRM|nr:substrate-binding domain-containing protein [Orenia marismortui]TDX48225.1 xylose-binding protein [Orenia marismortui]
MKKKVLGLLIVILVISNLFASISLASWFDEEDDINSNQIKIGFLLKTMQEERYLRDKFAFEDEVKRLGAKLIFDAASNDENLQLARFKRMLDKNVDVVVLQPVSSNKTSEMIELAHKQGVKVVGYDSLILNADLDAHVMQDSWAVGRLQGEAMLEWFKEKKGKVEGNVVLIKGHPNDSNAIMMTSGAKRIIKNNSGLNLVAERWHKGWSSDKAMATAVELLDKYDNNIDAFICNNSGMARGIIAALEAKGLADSDKVFVAGSDADLQNIKYLVQGKQNVEIFKKIKPLAKAAANLAYKLAKNPRKEIKELTVVDRMLNNGYKEVPTIVTPIVRVIKDNIDQTVIKADFYDKDDIYKD